MILKISTVLFLASLSLAQNPLLYCNLAIIDERCTCNFVIYNPAGFNNLTMAANPVTNCTLDDVVDATGSGLTKNIPSVLCDEFSKLENLRLNRLAIENINGNPFKHCINLKRLYLSGNALTAIPAYTFSNTILEILELDSNKLSSINSLTFDSLSQLEMLNLTNNPTPVTAADVFDSLENLKFLHLSHCNINILDPIWFSKLFNLVGLNLSTNNIDVVFNSTFNNLLKLEWLDLSGNKVETYPSNMVHNNTNLLKLNLNGNSFRIFDSNFFVSQSKLTELILSNNPTINITAELLEPLTSLQVIGLSSCGLSKVESSWFESMKDLIALDLSGNKINVIPEKTFSAANDIESINLAYNSIETLNSRSFGSLTKLRSLTLNNNTIKEIDHHFVSQPTDLMTVNFEYNSCSSYKTDNFNFNRTSYMGAMRSCFDNFDIKPIDIKTTNSSIYNWYSIRSSDGWDALKIFVKADENVHIALTDSLNKETPRIEIQIGQNRNRFSFIFEDGQEEFEEYKRYRLNSTIGSTFVIGWRFDVIMVFKEGDQFPFMAHTKKKGTPAFNFFGIRTPFEDDPDSIASWIVSRIQPIANV
ncbi:unnamed protein product [Chironomus riparius]|uniref:Farnesoic acid O-methyl transferase domain-containing protein n=1 Tax=Chironomus riparius TaxID=315576 RepID=A0A9N9S7C5_9DIPT|nr:unnamed protein product [Chironomus riparius]